MTNIRSHIVKVQNRESTKILWPFLLFFVSVFYPLGVEKGGLFLWIELLAPVFFGILLVENILHKRPMLIPGNTIYFSAILVLIIWAIISWIKFPLYSIGNDESSSGTVSLKSYYRIVVGVAVFFSSIWYSRYYMRNEFVIYIKILLYFSLFIGILRLLSFFMGFDIPFMYGVFRYNLESTSAFGGTTFRLTGLDVASYCGTFSLLTLRQTKHSIKTIWFVLLMIVFAVFIFLHAGRTAAPSYILTLLYYGFFIERINAKKMLIGLAAVILLVISLQFLPTDIYRGQINRMTSVSGGVQGQYSDRRGYIFRTFVEEFYNHPVFGRGIKPVSIGRADRNTHFIQMQLSDGGHGSYVSMLGLFGLGGIFFLAVFLFLTIAKTHLILARPRSPDRALYIFIMLFLVYKLLLYYTSGKGYNDYSLYFLVGMFVGFQDKRYGIVKKIVT